MQIKGLYTAVITPFKSNGELDVSGLHENLQFQLQHQVDGIVVLGTTGEAPTLNAQERTKIIEIAVEEVKGKAALIVGTGSYSTEQTIHHTLEAQKMGADAVLIITPYYNKPNKEGLYRHFATICEATDIPICIYNNPTRTGHNFTPDILARLLHFPSIVSFKDSSGCVIQFAEILKLIEEKRESFTLISGDDIYTFPLMALGGHGIVSVASNLIPGHMRDFVQSALSGDLIQARKWHFLLMDFFRSIFIESNPIPIKAAMDLCGMAAGPCRLPLCHIDPSNLLKIKPVINKLYYGKTKSSCCETAVGLSLS